jgi:hypothetical protein
MRSSRRVAVLNLVASAALLAQTQDPQENNPHTLPIPRDPSEDSRLPNGKSQKNAMAKQDHEQALKDANDLIAVAEELRDELKKSGDYVVSVSSVKKTEEIERLAKRIRGRLKD